MKKILIGVISFLLMGSLAWAATSINISAKADVPSLSPQITVILRKSPEWGFDKNVGPWGPGTSNATSMDFGQLVYKLKDGADAEIWFSKWGYCAVIYAKPFGKPYEIRSTASLSGPSSLPTGCFGLVPAYTEKDLWKYPDGTEKPQGPMPTGASLGVAGPATGTNKLIYSSEPGTGTTRIIQAYYSLPPYEEKGAEPFPGFKPITLEQKPGAYTGAVTITITPK